MFGFCICWGLYEVRSVTVYSCTLKLTSMPVAQVLYDKYAEAESTVDVLAILAVYGWVHILLLWPCVVAANHLGFEVRRVLLLVTAHFGRCCACSMIHALFACSPDFRVAIHGGTPDSPVLSAGLIPVQLRIQPGYGGVCVFVCDPPSSPRSWHITQPSR